MSEPKNDTSPSSSSPSYLERVVSNDAVKRGAAGAAAGLLVALVSEALWPSS